MSDVASPPSTTATVVDVARANAALRRLDLTVRRRLDSLVPGEHAGLRSGVGGEPGTSRPYRPGQDDVRRIDWAGSARTGELQVRGTVAEHELETWVLVDASASMDFGTAVLEKRELAVAVVAAVGALTDAPGNRLGASVSTPSTAQGLRTERARPGRAARLALLRALTALPRHEPGPLAATRLAGGLERLRRQRRRTGLRIVVSDLLPDGGADPSGPPDWEAPLRRLAARHDVVVVEVVDPRDAALPDIGALVLLDPETGRRREVRTHRRLRADFAAAVRTHRAANAAAVRRAGASHLVLHTDGDWVTEIARFAHVRRRARRSARRIR